MLKNPAKYREGKQTINYKKLYKIVLINKIQKILKIFVYFFKNILYFIFEPTYSLSPGQSLPPKGTAPLPCQTHYHATLTCKRLLRLARGS